MILRIILRCCVFAAWAARARSFFLLHAGRALSWRVYFPPLQEASSSFPRDCRSWHSNVNPARYLPASAVTPKRLPKLEARTQVDAWQICQLKHAKEKTNLLNQNNCKPINSIILQQICLTKEGTAVYVHNIC